jgi:phosphatidylinositol-3,4,5-trisphosphate 3-phosphatase/dual-specificity protein phosphatase PTEN
MNYLRTLVSGKKKRYIDENYNLDLSYITPRIIAMAYPASGLQSVYRNDIKTVDFHVN